MMTALPVAAIAAVMLGGSAATAAQLPTFEMMGLPITPHQVAVVGAGSARVQERSPTPTLRLGSMPASPHQIAVLTRRSKVTGGAAAANLTHAGVR